AFPAGKGGGVFAVALSWDGGRIATAGERSVSVWDAESGLEKDSLKGHGPNGVSGVVFRPDGNSLVTAGVDRTLRIWHLETGKEKPALVGHKGQVRRVVFSPDGKRLLSGGDYQEGLAWKGEVKVWDAETGREVVSLQGFTGTVNGLAYSADGKRFVSGGV